MSPRAGRAVERFRLRPLLAAALAASFVIALAACNGDPETDTRPESRSGAAGVDGHGPNGGRGGAAGVGLAGGRGGNGGAGGSSD